ncbi:MAG: hypothetical protein IPO12_06655 [Flavobacteriales bacterium]|nr:hypothetical protein [Flavobacteriales bacterium]
MSPRSSASRSGRTLNERRRIPRAVLDPVLIRPRPGRKAQQRTVSLQWHDGVGDLQFYELSPAQSWPYLSEDQER